ncbi:MAG: galactose mutarotase [Tenericutes bacterium]|nr:galactose mutarotase [Mycoplasmatota bacterium]
MYLVKKIDVNKQEWTFIIVDRKNICITLMNYGAAIYTLDVPDKDNKMENVVITYENLSSYIKNKRHINATIGPSAGRIQNAEFKINGEIYHLDKNFEGKHNLHGGLEALSYTLFDYNIKENEDSTIIEFAAVKNQKKIGYPGNQKFKIVYTIFDSEIKIDFFANTDEATIINLTNHAYFNLSGNLKSDVLNQEMMINASKKMTLNEDMIPIGVEKITETPFDFLNMHPIQVNDLLEIDDPYMLNEVNDKIIQASLYDRKSQRHLDIYTTYPTIVCYTDNFPMTYPLKYGVENITHMGVCFEAQNPPNGICLEDIESSILLPADEYHHSIRYVFSIKK